MESYVFRDSGRTNPFLHRMLCPAPFQPFENQSGLFRAVTYQSQRFIAYRDDVLCLGLLRNGVDTFSSGGKVNDFFPAKGKHITEPQAGQTRKEGSSFKNRYLARCLGQSVQFFD
jgi:hypothetical protein